jgi:hypothetical protein
VVAVVQCSTVQSVEEKVGLQAEGNKEENWCTEDWHETQSNARIVAPTEPASHLRRSSFLQAASP